MLYVRVQKAESNMVSSLICLLFILSNLNICKCTGEVDIVGRVLMPQQFTDLLGQIRVTLNGGLYTALTTVSGHFSFYDIPSGVYILDVSEPNFAFSQMKLKIDSGNLTKPVTAVEYKFPGAKRRPAEYPLVLVPHTRIGYFEKRQNVSIWKMIFANPTMLMVVFSVAVIVGFPMMLKNIDPEELKEMQKKSVMNNPDMQDPMKAMSKMFGIGGNSSNNNDDDDD